MIENYVLKKKKKNSLLFEFPLISASFLKNKIEMIQLQQ